MFSSLLSSSQGAKTTSSKEQLLALHTKEALRVKIPSKLEEEEANMTCTTWVVTQLRANLPRKEVTQPQLPLRLPCYDFTPIIDSTFDGCLLTVSPPASGVSNFRGVTGGVYKARERIHPGMLIRDY